MHAHCALACLNIFYKASLLRMVSSLTPVCHHQRLRAEIIVFVAARPGLSVTSGLWRQAGTARDGTHQLQALRPQLALAKCRALQSAGQYITHSGEQSGI